MMKVKGRAPMMPPLTNEGRWALQDILSTSALKGVAFEAVQTGLWEDELLWRGVADMAK